MGELDYNKKKSCMFHVCMLRSATDVAIKCEYNANVDFFDSQYDNMICWGYGIKALRHKWQKLVFC